MEKDLTTGKITPQLIGFTIPLVLGNLFQTPTMPLTVLLSDGTSEKRRLPPWVSVTRYRLYLYCF